MNRVLTASLLVFCQFSAALPLEKIKLPEGFKITVLTDQVPGARQMALAADGTLFVGSMRQGKVYSVKDGKVTVIAKGLDMPVGVELDGGDLYVSAVNRILKFKGSKGDPQVIYDKLPSDHHHGWKYLRIGPDRKLYFSIGAPCNVCLSKDPRYASLARIDLDGNNFEIIAHGVRNSVGLAFHPKTGKLWFTDNGRDWMGDDQPDCELNVLNKSGDHFGFPFCHAGNIQDPEFTHRTCKDFQPPVLRLGAHVAPLGLAFYKGDLIIAKHGSWNRSRKSGYTLERVKLAGDKVVSNQTFASGWLDEKTQKVWGRPVDVLVTPDGALLVSDDEAGAIYKITQK